MGINGKGQWEEGHAEGCTTGRLNVERREKAGAEEMCSGEKMSEDPHHELGASRHLLWSCTEQLSFRRSANTHEFQPTFFIILVAPSPIVNVPELELWHLFCWAHSESTILLSVWGKAPPLPDPAVTKILCQIGTGLWNWITFRWRLWGVVSFPWHRADPVSDHTCFPSWRKESCVQSNSVLATQPDSGRRAGADPNQPGLAAAH